MPSIHTLLGCSNLWVGLPAVDFVDFGNGTVGVCRPEQRPELCFGLYPPVAQFPMSLLREGPRMLPWPGKRDGKGTAKASKSLPGSPSLQSSFQLLSFYIVGLHLVKKLFHALVSRLGLFVLDPGESEKWAAAVCQLPNLWMTAVP